jgi:hypothetical protein
LDGDNNNPERDFTWASGLNSNQDKLFSTEVYVLRVSLIRHLCLGKRPELSGRVEG